jgi:succinate dehydrogenase / fumarate reductase, cytochrome b subunit
MTTESTLKVRPKNLDLTSIKLPLPGWVSILHRISGAGMFLIGIPLVLSVLDCSLASQEGFDWWRERFAHPAVKLVLIGFLWAYLHHFCAGLRFLALDIHWGTSLAAARMSAKLVLIVSLALTFAIAVWLW